MPEVQVRHTDWSRSADCTALRELMQHYASDPMGGGQPLSEAVLEQLPRQLAEFPGTFSAIAWRGDEAVGLINGFAGFSTFKARPLLNLHDIVVLHRYRGQGISRQLLQTAEVEARRRGCCKLTLEVLEGNTRAQQVYRACGFAGYELDPACGRALFMEKPL